MVDIVEQLCIESFEIKALNGDCWKAKQGKVYTTTISDKKETIIVFSNFWVKVPKKYFVLCKNA